MFDLATNPPPRTQQDYASCSACGLCLLVCPVWRRTHDLGLTPLARAKALLFGATAAELADSIRSCTLCGACEPACPEDIDLIEMTLELRRQLPPPAGIQALHDRMEPASTRQSAAPAAGTLLLPDQALRAQPATLARVSALLGNSGGAAIAQDDACDIALALEAGTPVPAQRLERFLQPLRGAGEIVVADGLLLRHLYRWLPRAQLVSLGVALSRLPALRGALRATDLYVIEARAYHADYRRLVNYYDGLRRDAGCAFNLDLQRMAIPAAARSLPQRLGQEAADDGVQARWLLQGRNVTRIVVEHPEDAAAFGQVCDLPVVHLAHLVQDGSS